MNNCFYTDCKLWTSRETPGGRGGKPSKASTVNDCQAECIDSDECTGFDWHDKSPHERCWLIGSWSAEREKGNTHYDLNKKCHKSRLILSSVTR